MRIALAFMASLFLTRQLPTLPLVKTGPQPAWLYPVHPDLHKIPARETFDHAIVALRHPSGAYTFVDHTRTNQRDPLADLYIPDYGYAPVLREEETGLQPVTPGRINDYAITETLDARYYDSSSFSINSIYSGCAADDLRGNLAEMSQKDLEEKDRKYYSELFDDIRQQDRISYSDDSEKNVITVSKHYTIPQLWDTENNDSYQFDFIPKVDSGITPDNTTAPNATVPSPPQEWKACWPAIWLTFFFTLAFSWLFQHLNSRAEETLYAPGSGYPLGGRIAILGINIGGFILLELARLPLAGYYSEARYTGYSNAGGHTMQYFFLSSLAIHLTFIAGAASLLYWFFRKRDIFPHMFFWYSGILLIGRLLLLGLTYIPNTPSILARYRTGMTIGLVSTLVFIIAWVTFLVRSEQVKSTFLEPFRERIR